MAYIAVAYIVMAYIAVAYIVMAQVQKACPAWADCPYGESTKAPTASPLPTAAPNPSSASTCPYSMSHVRIRRVYRRAARTCYEPLAHPRRRGSTMLVTVHIIVDRQQALTEVGPHAD